VERAEAHWLHYLLKLGGNIWRQLLELVPGPPASRTMASMLYHYFRKVDGRLYFPTRPGLLHPFSHGHFSLVVVEIDESGLVRVQVTSAWTGG
jgi:hypothetical protein